MNKNPGPYERRHCVVYLRAHLAMAMEKRGESDDWCERERLALTVAANEWAMARDMPTITTDDVEAVEHFAIGHSDYAKKLCLYVAERLYGEQGA